MPRRPLVAAGSHAVRPHHERHPERRLVGEEAVRQLAVLAQRLAVVRGDHHQGRCLAAGEERLEERRQERVQRRHLAEIGIVPEARGEGLGRSVRRVGVEEVDPQKALLARLRLPPGEGRRHHLVPAPFGEHQLRRPRALGHAVVVDGEAAVEPELRVERKGADESCRLIAGRAQQGRERRHLGSQDEAAVLAHAVLERVEPGQDVGVRRQGDDVVGVRVGEVAPGRGQAVEHRRLRLDVAGEAQSVGADRVERHQHHVAAGRRRSGGRGGRGTAGDERGSEEAGGEPEMEVSDPHRAAV